MERELEAYYAARAKEYDRIYHIPDRQADLRALPSGIGRDVSYHRFGYYWVFEYHTDAAGARPRVL